MSKNFDIKDLSQAELDTKEAQYQRAVADVSQSEANIAIAQSLADTYMAQHPNVTIAIETRPTGSEGDNLVKTRLATGDMADLFTYNSGSLLQALNPSETLVDLAGADSREIVGVLVDTLHVPQPREAWTTMAQWRRETLPSAMMTSLSGIRPMLLRPGLRG